MALNGKAALHAVEALVTGLPGMQEVIRGVPEGFTRDVVAMVAAGPRTLVDKNTGIVMRELAIVVAMGVRVAGNEGAAEDTLLDLEDALIDGWISDRTLAGTVDSSFPEDRSGDPDYRLVLGQEFRVRVYHLNTTQRRAF